MKKHVMMFLLATSTLAIVVSTTEAQRNWQGRNESQEIWDRTGVPEWQNDGAFQKDVFTFVRIRYDSSGSGFGWQTDWPASDLNFSFRLQQLTSLKVNPVAKNMRLTDPDLFNYPFIYIVEPGGLYLSDADIKALRRYLANGGFLMFDDFWGQRELNNLYREMRRVFPDREPQELPLSHPIFHYVYDLKKKPQIPDIIRGRQGITYETPTPEPPHYKGIFDDDDRMMVIICHNTDLGDGWEREGENEFYFREFSEKYAYPLGINIVTYAMTH